MLKSFDFEPYYHFYKQGLSTAIGGPADVSVCWHPLICWETNNADE